MIRMLVIGEPDAERRACTDCRHMQAAVTWWCMNGDAARAHGTRTPAFAGCSFWSPAEQLGRNWRQRLWKRLFSRALVIDLRKERTGP